jgi:hypothetical protein
MKHLLESFTGCLTLQGIALVTFVETYPDSEREPEYPGMLWMYPGCTSFHRETILGAIEQAGLYGSPLPWQHPRQTWYVLSRSTERVASVIELLNRGKGDVEKLL